MKPIIGVLSYPYYDKDNTGVIEVNTKVVNFINELGGIPISILPVNRDDFYIKNKNLLNNLSKEELIKLRTVLGMCDGIIKPGSYHFFPFQIDTYKYVLERDVPYLGICQGLQLMSRCINPTLSMEKNNSTINHKNGCHKINIHEETLLYKILGKKVTTVRSFHNYHVPHANGFVISATSQDGYIEAMEHKNSSYNIGLQWHPEGDMNGIDSIKIFESFIEASKVYKKTK